VIARAIIASIIILTFTAVVFLPKTDFNTSYLTEAKTEATVAAIVQNPEILPKRISTYQDPQQLTAKSAIILDAKTGTQLFKKDPDLKHLPASTTKLMTALVALESCSPEQVITVGPVEKEGSQMGLSAGDKMTVENLLYGMLIPSGNDAGMVLATSCARSYDQFIARMNEKAVELGMTNSHFVNAVGFDNDFQYSTAMDLARLAKVAVANPLISKIVDTKSTVVTDVTGKKTYFLENVNKLLGNVEGIEGIKTGETEGALEILISKTTRNNNSIIVVVLGSKHRFDESKKLIEWAYKNYFWSE